MKDFLNSGQTFFLVKCNGEKNGRHRIVIALISRCLRVATHSHKKPVEMRLIFAA